MAPKCRDQNGIFANKKLKKKNFKKKKEHSMKLCTLGSVKQLHTHCWCPFFESVPWGRKPNEKQGPKACQEDQRVREVQRKKCKGKGSVAEYKSATEYKFAAK